MLVDFFIRLLNLSFIFRKQKRTGDFNFLVVFFYIFTFLNFLIFPVYYLL